MRCVVPGSNELGPKPITQPSDSPETIKAYSSLRKQLATMLKPTSSEKYCKDSFLWYLNGVIQRNLGLKKDAIKSLALSLKLQPNLWASWQELSRCVDFYDTKSLTPIIDTICPEDNICKMFFIIKYLNKIAVYAELVDTCLTRLKADYGLDNTCDFLAAEAEFLNSLQNYPGCIEKYRNMRKIDPYRFEDTDNYSNVLFTSSSRQDLATLAHELNDVEPYRYETCVVTGNYYSLRGDHQKAIDFFERAIRLNPLEKSGIYILLGHEYTEINESQLAINAYKKAQVVDPNDHRSWYSLGQKYEILQMHLASFYYYSKAAQLQPYNTTILSALADSMVKCGKQDSAEVLYRRCVAIVGNETEENDIEGQMALYRLAKFYEETEKTTLAAHYYSLYVKRLENCGSNDTDVIMEVYIYLAKFFKSENQFELAEEYAKDALRGVSTKDEAKKILAEISDIK